MARPVIAITMGDAAGVGPEILMKALAHATVYERCRPLVIGDAERLRAAGRSTGAELRVQAVEEPGAGRSVTGSSIASTSP